MDDTKTLDLTHTEFVALNNALNEVLHGPDAIEEWEFHTRMGVTKEEAKKLHEKVARAAGFNNTGIA